MAVRLALALFFLAPGGSLAGAPPAKSGLSPSLMPRVLSFSLDNETVTGSIPFGSELVLGVLLQGRKSDHSLVAVAEGPSIDKIMVPLEPAEAPGQWKGRVVIKPHPLGYTSVRPKALWVRVTIAQKLGTRLLRLIGRTAYITTAHDEPLSLDHELGNGEEDQAPHVEVIVAAPPELGDEIETQPDVAPVANVLIAEEDLKPLPPVQGQQAYWNEIARLISRSWGQKVRYARNLQSARDTVRVAFRMHPNGEAQLIQVERTSGVRDVDEAGLQAIVQAHPFPPFKQAVQDAVVDVHVRMRTGAKQSAMVQQSVVSPAAKGTKGDVRSEQGGTSPKRRGR